MVRSILKKKRLKNMSEKNKTNYARQKSLRKTFQKKKKEMLYERHVQNMLHSYGRIRLFLSGVNRMKVKSMICNRTITKYLSIFGNYIFDLTTMFCGTIIFSNTLVLLFKPMAETCTFKSFCPFLPKLIPRIVLVLKF